MRDESKRDKWIDFRVHYKSSDLTFYCLAKYSSHAEICLCLENRWKNGDQRYCPKDACWARIHRQMNPVNPHSCLKGKYSCGSHFTDEKAEPRVSQGGAGI